MTSRVTRLWGAAAIACMGLFSEACTAPEACAEIGVVESCSCGAVPGGRVCLAERNWGSCDCTGTVPIPNPVLEVDASVGGTGGISGTGGTGGISGTGGTGGISGTGGTGGTVEAYGACATEADCVPDARCLSNTIAPETFTVCAPKCLVASDCPRGGGSYDAVVRCIEGYCGLDCTPPLFAPLLKCPTNMDCIVLGAGAAFCHDADGM